MEDMDTAMMLMKTMEIYLMRLQSIMQEPNAGEDLQNSGRKSKQNKKQKLKSSSLSIKNQNYYLIMHKVYDI